VVGLETEDGVRTAFDAVVAAGLEGAGEISNGTGTLRGVLVERQAPAGVELIVGAQRDPHYGPLILVGLGGLLAEVLDDVSVRLAPVTTDEARAMLGELRGAAVLRASRGRPAVDLDAVAELIVALGRALDGRPEWHAVDLNPVIAGPNGALAVDALIVLASA